MVSPSGSPRLRSSSNGNNNGRQSKIAWFMLGGFAVAFVMVLSFQFYVSGGAVGVWDIPFDLSIVPPAYTSDYFMYRAHARHQIRAQLGQHPENTLAISERCSQLTQHEQLLDVECTALWTHVLHSGTIVGVKKLWGFTNTHNGAITLELEGGVRALFKPCTSRAEDTSREVIASHIDHILGLGQVAPAVYRKISIETLRKLVGSDPEDISNFQITESTCKIDDEYFFGPMIGWWNGLMGVRTEHKAHQDENKISKLRDKFFGLDSKKANRVNLYYAQAESRFHTLYWLTDILRHGKDEFVTPEGQLVSLDFDRSKYSRPRDINEEKFTWCEVCLMDEKMYHTLRVLGPEAETSAISVPAGQQAAPSSHAKHHRLGDLIASSLKYEEVKRNIWPQRYANTLTTRVGDLFSCIDYCAKRLGPENVLLGEDYRAMHPTKLTDRKIVRWYVLESEYKMRNGMERPENFAEIVATSEEDEQEELE